MIGEAQGKKTGKVAVVGAAAGLYIGNPSDVVFFLQIHVHDIGFVAKFLVQTLPEQARLVIDLNVFHHVGRQVIEHNLAVAVEQQALHIFAVDVDASVVLELHARHLTDESVEHAALRQLESIGIIHQRVALVIELDLCGPHLHAFQVYCLGPTF